MKKSMKAALLSGLVFPGTGQLYLGQRRRGWALILPYGQGVSAKRTIKILIADPFTCTALPE